MKEILQKPKIILELAKNHNGDMNLAREMIREAARLKVHGVKLQAYDKSDILKVHDNHERYIKCHFSIEQLEELCSHAKVLGLDFWCSCFSSSLIRPLRSFTHTIKIPSTFFNRSDFVRNCVYSFNNIHMSTGFHTTKYITNHIREYRLLKQKKQFIFYLCTSLYPTPNEFLRLDKIASLKLKGFSYHGKEQMAIIAAWLRGAEYIELHFGTCNEYSHNSESIYLLNQEIDRIYKMFKINDITPKEKENYNFFKGEYRDLNDIEDRNISL